MRTTRPAHLGHPSGLVLAIFGLCFSGCPEPPAPQDPCSGHNCGPHGSCSEVDGNAQCACQTGYGGDTCGGCAAGFVEWPAGSGACVDDPCAPDPCTALHQVSGSCQQTSAADFSCACTSGYGGVACQSCVAGYHDDGAGGCAVDVACLSTTCNQHGSCDDTSGVPVCACDTGYASDHCDACQTGYNEWPASSGTCVDDPCVPDPCTAVHEVVGSCTQTGASAFTCQCQSGYSGTSCEQCDTSYVEWPASSGICVDDPCAPDPCTGTGQAAGSCAQTGATSYGCSCAGGFVEWPASSGTCVDDPCEPDPCSGANQVAGTCSQTGATAHACTCLAGYATPLCSGCAAGFVEWPASSGTCVDDPCAPDPCTVGHQTPGSCAQIAAAEGLCACDTGFAGALCDTCALGFTGASCDSCAAGYEGAACDMCSPGFHDDGSGACIADTSCLATTCAGHGICDDASGSPLCTCELGYSGPNCATCAALYVEHPVGSRTCIRNRCFPDPCRAPESVPGTCSLVAGDATRHHCDCAEDCYFDTQITACVAENSFADTYRDLIPPNAQQVYDPRRFALTTGLVQDPDGAPLAGVEVSVLGRPELGTTTTDAGGRFSLPVNGGGIVTLVYQGQGLLRVDRQVHVPWNDTGIAETIKMTALDPASTTVTFDGNPETVVVHEGSTVIDDSGSRSATVVFTGDNHAYLVDEDGNEVQELHTVVVRATEYSTPESMPAVLPPTSAFTYCVELGADGAQRVRFEKPVVTWVDNFLGFGVGEIVPVGYYDRDRGVWVPSDNGVVVKLLDTSSDGLVDAIDVNGDDMATVPEDDLDGDGDLADEVEGLADPVRYPPGATFWRVAVAHFTPWDGNWPSGPPPPPPNAIAPNPETPPEVDVPEEDEKEKECESSSSCTIEERSRVFREDILIPGTDLTLHYASNRVDGYKQASIIVPASGDNLPLSMRYIIVRLDVAGNSFEQTFSPLPYQKAEFDWGGLDHLGMPVGRPVTARVSIGFVYTGFYRGARQDVENAFGNFGSITTTIPSRNEVILWKHSEHDLAPPRPAKAGSNKHEIAEGWTISNHHWLRGPTLHKGDSSRLGKSDVNHIATVAGTGVAGYSGDDGPATEARIYNATALAFDSGGNLYIADGGNRRIRKVDTTGTITSIAGGWAPACLGENIPATEIDLMELRGVAVDINDNILIASMCGIHKVDASGIITLVAGDWLVSGYYGDNGPAREAGIGRPFAVAADSVGNIYIVDSYYRIRKVDAGGIITTVVGTGTQGCSGDNGPSTQATIDSVQGLAVDRAGNLYLADENCHRIRKVDTSGIITTVAGTGIAGYSGDNGQATSARLYWPGGVAVDGAGNIYIGDGMNRRVRKVNTSGIITTVAGTGTAGYSGDNGPATLAGFRWPYSVVVDGSGSIYVGDVQNARVRKVSPAAAFRAFTAAGDSTIIDPSGLGYIMSPSGRHKTTFDVDTKTVLQQFGYDGDNNLVSIADRFGGETAVSRDSQAKPTAIVSADGITTFLTVDSNNRLTQITYPDGGFYAFEYSADGLMLAETDPQGHRYEHLFNAAGRVIETSDEEGSHWQYSSHTMNAAGDIVTEITSGSGGVTSMVDHTYSSGIYTSTMTEPSGATTVFNRSADALTVTKTKGCGRSSTYSYGLDPEYGFDFVKEVSERVPSSLTKTTTFGKVYQDRDLDDVPDLVTESTTVNGKAATLAHDVLAGTFISTSPAGRTVTTTYDKTNLLPSTSTIAGLSTTSYAYDSAGRLIETAVGDRSSSLTYDAQGRVSSEADAAGNAVYYAYDAMGRITELQQQDGLAANFTYDLNGNLTGLTTPSGQEHSFAYNGVNLSTSYVAPTSGSYSYSYDLDRRLVQTVLPSGAQINNVYTNGRLTQVVTPEGNTDLAYACSEQVSALSRNGEAIAYAYNGHLPTSETLSGTLAKSLTYTYNNDFRMTSMGYAGGVSNLGYDNDGLLTSSAGFAIARHAGNGLITGVAGGPLVQTYSNNGYGELEGVQSTVAATGAASWQVTRDTTGRILTKTETIAGVTTEYAYTYDVAGRLLTASRDGVVTESYSYGAGGMRVGETNTLKGVAGRALSYSAEDQTLAAGSVTYEYNLDGFLQRRVDGTDVTSYDYSSIGELLSVTLPDTTLVEYVYDPLGRRIAKKINGTVVEKYLWSGLLRLLAVYDGSDALTHRFLYAEGRLPVAVEKSGATYYLTYDQAGSLRAAVNVAGTVVKRVDYDSFGMVIADSNPSLQMLLGFAGGLHDRDTGLVQFVARDYDPDLGRWTSKDPLFFMSGTVDLYGYCMNDPINFVDPLGLRGLSDGDKAVVKMASLLGGALGAALGGGALSPLTSGIGSALFGAVAAQALGGSGKDIREAGLSGLASGMLKNMSTPYKLGTAFLAGAASALDTGSASSMLQKGLEKMTDSAIKSATGALGAGVWAAAKGLEDAPKACP